MPSFPCSWDRWSDIYSGEGKVLFYGIKSLLSWWRFTSQMANRSWCDRSRNYFKSGLRNLGLGADFSLLCDRSACPGCPGCTLLPACWPTLLVTLMRRSQASARNTQCLHFVSAKTVLLMISEHRTTIPGLFPHIFFQPDIYSGSTYTYPTSSRPIGKVSLDCIWVTASLLPWSVLV